MDTDQLLAGADPKTAFDPNGLLDELKKALAERALNAEMDHHLAGEHEAGNGRNGYGKKTVVTDTSRLELDIPRDNAAHKGLTEVRTQSRGQTSRNLLHYGRQPQKQSPARSRGFQALESIY